MVRRLSLHEITITHLKTLFLIIMAKNKREPKLPNLPKKNKAPKPYLVQTEHLDIEFISKKVYKQCLEHCDLMGVNLEHYMLEFNINEDNVMPV